MSESATKQTVRRLYEEVVNEGRLELLDEIAQPDHHEHNPLPGQVQGVEGLKQRVSMVRGAFNPRFTIEHLLEDGDTVAIMWSNQGTHEGEWLGVAPTGRRFENVDEVYVFRLEGDRIVAAFGVEDNLARIRQLGLSISAPPHPSGEAS